MCGSPSYDDAHDPKYRKPYKVPMVVASDETLKGYGKIVRDFDKEEVEITPWPVSGSRKLYPGIGAMAGIMGGEFVYTWEGDVCKALDDVDANHYITGRLPADMKYDNRTYVLVREANYHPDSGQVFYPRDHDPFVALLALPGDDIKSEDFVAFYFDGSFGVQIHADIWHQQVYPISDRAVFLGKQGAVHACVNIDTADEWGIYLSVPLKLNA